MIIRQPRSLPKPETPLVASSGLMSRDWYDYLRELDLALRQVLRNDEANATTLADLETRVTDLETP